MELVEVQPGEFTMGNSREAYSRDLCFGELPAHSVRLTRAFRIGKAAVTAEQFRQFRPDFRSAPEPSRRATGMTWYDAVAFCEWLTRKEGKPYRLPTEAEWEFAARQADQLGLVGMLSGDPEWCLDWYGSYPDEAEVDPTGPASGVARVVRGGCLDENAQAPPCGYVSHRSGMAPGFGTYPGAPADHGQHRIGFRVVQAAMPATPPRPAFTPMVQEGIKQTTEYVRQGPDPSVPYFRKRYLLPIPPDNAPTPAIDALSLPTTFRRHNHSPALTVCPNGDVLMVCYTSYHEYEPEVSLMACRLRFGVDQWDMPSPFVDFPGANDHAPLLCTEGEVVRLFWGNPRLPGAFPFQWMESRDNGATWSEVRFPHFVAPPGPHSRQPINTFLRDRNGVMHLPSDGVGATSVLWESEDNGVTWRDPGSRSAGRHTTYCLLSDGRILGMGGKKSDIDGFMPAVVSSDGGRTWETHKTIFPALGTNQRPSLLRLQSGRLFFAGDYQDIQGRQPAGIEERGSYVALSEDDGRTWHVKKLIGTQPHEVSRRLGGSDTLGYSVAAQAPNGMIHLITTMNHPCLHFELNEAWILAPETPATEEELMAPPRLRVSAVTESRETFPDGRPRVVWHGGLTEDGRYVLHGRETRFDPNGKPRYQVTYQCGRKVGTETLWRKDGSVEWEWQHGNDGVGTWTQYWPGGRKKAESHWRGRVADGSATVWDREGNEVGRARFDHGEATIEVPNALLAPRGRALTEKGGAVVGAACYVDRDYRLVSLPAELVGCDLVRTANDDDYSTRPDHLVLDLPADTRVFVCYWAAARELPSWLKRDGWKRQEGQVQVGIGRKQAAYNIYSRVAPKGRIALGGNERENTGAASMYFVLLQSLTPKTAGD